MSKLTHVFSSVLGIPESAVVPELSPETTSAWDSLNAIILLTEIEKAFDARFSYEEARVYAIFADVLSLVASKGLIPMPESAVTRFEDIAVGSAEQFEVTLTDEMVRQFSLLSGDFSPLHMDDEYASQTPLGRRIAHGMLGASLFSRLVGMHLPGRHALYLSQTLLFRKPCEIGTTVAVRGSVTHKTEATKTITLHTSVFDKADDTLFDRRRCNG